MASKSNHAVATGSVPPWAGAKIHLKLPVANIKMNAMRKKNALGFLSHLKEYGLLIGGTGHCIAGAARLVHPHPMVRLEARLSWPPPYPSTGEQPCLGRFVKHGPENNDLSARSQGGSRALPGAFWVDGLGWL